MWPDMSGISPPSEDALQTDVTTRLCIIMTLSCKGRRRHVCCAIALSGSGGAWAQHHTHNMAVRLAAELRHDLCPPSVHAKAEEKKQESLVQEVIDRWPCDVQQSHSMTPLLRV